MSERKATSYAGKFLGLAGSTSSFLTLTIMAAAAQVVPDGGTATTVTTNPTSGAQTVSIAPTPNISGISHNTYTDFSVAPAGVNLDNRSVNARTILNEVTSARTSNLNGPLEVLGARAHVVIANPNGISVDGGTFINMGGVVLSTGKPSIITREIAPGFNQDNVVLDTGSGLIDVGPGGLSAAVTSLQLIAGKIRVDGPVENASENIRSDLRLTAGGSSVEYDSSILPISDLENWGRVTEKPTDDGSIAVEITERGSLKANTVRIRATNKGAGVSHAGKGLASSGDFVIDASGKVTTKGSILAARNVKIRGRSIAASSTVGQPQATIEAVNGALTLLATTGDITNTGVLMSGKTRDPTDADSKGGATLKAAGDIKLLTENADQLAIVFASEGDLVAEAGGDVTNDTGRFLSNAKTSITAGGDINNVTDMVATDATIGEWTHEVSYGKRLWYTLWQDRLKTETFSVTYGEPRIAGQQAYLVGAEVELKAGGDVTNRGSSINANEGSVDIEAANIFNQASASGSLTFTRTCGLVCVGYGTSTTTLIGGGINANKDVRLTADKLIHNKGGQFTAYGDTVLTAPEVILEGINVPTVYTRPPGLYNFWQGSSAWIGATDFGGVVVAPQGSVTIDAFKPVLVNAGVIEAGGDVIIPSGTEIVAPPASTLPFGKDPIGLFRELAIE